MLALLLVLGAFGLAVVLAGLLLGELLDGAVDAALPGDLGPGVTPALGAALAAFGFGGALALRAADLPAGAALGLGAAGAVGVGAAVVALSRALQSAAGRLSESQVELTVIAGIERLRSHYGKTVASLTASESAR